MNARKAAIDWWSVFQVLLIFNAVFAFLRFGLAAAGYGDPDADSGELLIKAGLWAWVAMLRHDLRRMELR